MVAQTELEQLLDVFNVLKYGIIGFMSQSTEGVSDLGNFSNFLNLMLIKHCFFASKIKVRHKADNSVSIYNYL